MSNDFKRVDFRTWLLEKQLGKHTPIGLFAAKVKTDASFPRAAYTWQAVNRYLYMRGASQAAITIAAIAYNAYRGIPEQQTG